MIGKKQKKNYVNRTILGRTNLSRLKSVSFVKFCKEMAEKSLLPRLPTVLLRHSSQ